MKRTIDLDFVPRVEKARHFVYLLLVVGISVSFYQVNLYFTLSTDLETWEATRKSVQRAQERPTNAPKLSIAPQEQMQLELKAADRIINRIAMPWDMLFEEIEASVGEHVTLLSIEPDAEKKEIRITAEARNIETMLEYVKVLRANTLFKAGHLLNHQVQQQDPQNPVRFSVTAKWIPSVSSSSPIHQLH